MKKVVFTFTLMLIASVALAQEAACSIGLQFGFNQNIYRVNLPSTIKSPDVISNDLHNTPLSGTKIGFVFDGNIIKGFGAYIALNYTYAGGGTNWKQNGVMLYPQTRSHFDLHNLELACDWQYKFEVAQHTYFILYSGPAIQLNLSLHETEIVKNFDEQTKKEKIWGVDYGNKDMFEAYQRINVLWGVGAGFQYKRYFVRGGYDFGLINPYAFKNFNEVLEKNTGLPIYKDQATRGRQDQWYIKVGIYLWQSDN